MSSYTKTTRHPITGKWEKAFWCDDYFGNHQYGVKFEGDDQYFNPEGLVMETKNNDAVIHIQNDPKSSIATAATIVGLLEESVNEQFVKTHLKYIKKRLMEIHENYNIFPKKK